MKLKATDIKKILIIFLFTHLIVWTVIPSITNINLTIKNLSAELGIFLIEK